MIIILVSIYNICTNVLGYCSLVWACWLWVLQRGHSGDGCDLASTLCRYELRKGEAGKYLFIAANVWWRYAEYFVIFLLWLDA